MSRWISSHASSPGLENTTKWYRWDFAAACFVWASTWVTIIAPCRAPWPRKKTPRSATAIVAISTMMMMTMRSSISVKPFSRRLIRIPPLVILVRNVVGGSRDPVRPPGPDPECLSIDPVLDRAIPGVHEAAVLHPLRPAQPRRQFFERRRREAPEPRDGARLDPELVHAGMRRADPRAVDEAEDAEPDARDDREHDEHHQHFQEGEALPDHLVLLAPVRHVVVVGQRLVQLILPVLAGRPDVDALLVVLAGHLVADRVVEPVDDGHRIRQGIGDAALGIAQHVPLELDDRRLRRHQVAADVAPLRDDLPRDAQMMMEAAGILLVVRRVLSEIEMVGLAAVVQQLDDRGRLRVARLVEDVGDQHDQQRDQERDDRDHHEDFDQREAFSSTHRSPDNAPLAPGGDGGLTRTSRSTRRRAEAALRGSRSPHTTCRSCWGAGSARPAPRRAFRPQRPWRPPPDCSGSRSRSWAAPRPCPRPD